MLNFKTLKLYKSPFSPPYLPFPNLSYRIHHGTHKEYRGPHVLLDWKKPAPYLDNQGRPVCLPLPLAVQPRDARSDAIVPSHLQREIAECLYCQSMNLINTLVTVSCP